MSLSSRPVEGQTEFDFGSDHSPDVGMSPVDFVAIPLKNGGVTWVDEADFCRVCDYEWRRKDRRTASYSCSYACRDDLSSGKRVLVFMHRHLFGLTKEDRTKVDHKNHDGLDNRRSTNLRLATQRQNAANNRKRADTASRYKGVTWFAQADSWVASITYYAAPLRKAVSLGYFDIEEEAAFAFQSVEPLLRDPKFICQTVIPPDRMPSLERQAEIRSRSIAKVKAILAGFKGRLDASSKYHGVNFDPAFNQFRASIRKSRKVYYLGRYTTEIEAALACNIGVAMIGPGAGRANVIPAGSVGPDREQEIRAEVASRVGCVVAGKKGKLNAHSDYRGVCLTREGNKWRAGMNVGERGGMSLGCYPTEIEAAYAYNCGASEVDGDNAILNTVDESQISGVTRRQIAETVRRKVAAIRAGEKGKLDCSSAYSGVSYDNGRGPKWATQVTYKSKRVKVGRFHTETEAALAYNFAAPAVGVTRFKANLIPDEMMPDRETVERVRLRIESRVANILNIGD